MITIMSAMFKNVYINTLQKMHHKHEVKWTSGCMNPAMNPTMTLPMNPNILYTTKLEHRLHAKNLPKTCTL